MRSAGTAVLWLIATVLFAAALPAMWAQQHLVDRAGYAALARQAAAAPELQSAMATELTAQVGRLGTGSALDSTLVDSTLVAGIARTYTASPAFPGQFAQANAFAHQWLFSGAAGSSVDSQGRWVIDLAPMLSDTAFAQTLRDFNIAVPSSLPIPLTDNAPSGLRPGALQMVGRWAPWISWGLAALTAAAAALTLLSARSRGKTLAALGASALLVGGMGWAAMEYAQRYLRQGLDNTSGNLRTVADVMVETAQNSMHQWLNISLIAGGGLVLIGVIVSLLVSLVR